MSNLGIKSTFQSFTRPYFFHGSSPGRTFPYVLNSCDDLDFDSQEGTHRTNRLNVDGGGFAVAELAVYDADGDVSKNEGVGLTYPP